jgi:hypothetical protein
MRVTSWSWVILRDRVLKMRNVDGRLHIATHGAQAGRVGAARSSARPVCSGPARKRLRGRRGH